MSKPIPDKTLLDFVEAEHELVSLPGYGTVSCSDLGTFGEDMARELLALREAAREAVVLLEDADGRIEWFGGDDGTYNLDDNIAASEHLRAFIGRFGALLPEEPEESR